MELKEFKRLSAEEQAKRVNARLEELEHQGLNTNKFKSEEFEFSYSTIAGHLNSMGYERQGKGPFRKTLSSREIETLQMLASNYDYLLSLKSGLSAYVKEHPVENIKTTTFRIDKDVLTKWQDFCKDHPAYSANELLNAALIEFMQWHQSYKPSPSFENNEFNRQRLVESKEQIERSRQ